MAKLGVNIDHVATLRQARREFDPSPVAAALVCEKNAAKSIVAHLREDRRHINDKDIKELRRKVRSRFNMEMSISKEIVDIACKLKPEQATLVPERRQEITTEGGLDVVKNFKEIKNVVSRLQKSRIEVSLFIAPNKNQAEAAFRTGAEMIEIHTGCYANAKTPQSRKKELEKIKKMTRYANQLGLIVNAGHGLRYDNVRPIAAIKGIAELNIGHSIISRAVFVGLKKAVGEMAQLIKRND